MKMQYINDETGKPQYVVLPIAEYEKLIDAQDTWEDVSYTPSKHDDVTVPNAVVNLMVSQEVSLLAAWRIYRDLSQYDVAEKLGTTQSTVSQWEASERPQKRTREKLAALYDCLPEQLIP
ncbi:MULTISPECIES: helix-turn-helix domain-containing protein [unclassified Serratia (in: enterobacteria)]|uniref:helix-turn-helix domain-containing protein n=1 Tax=unclassified Serratia (in: enterobacteria) TaxID=2647522 RepID=UPI000500908E|nr:MULTISPECIES: helix-turn-helix transcriptional regulator [unclassified Serratia (in: enterobacteria)]KFK92855.1 2-hydroxyacid dehydrogenase [Serratia sp. Ag2]KFK94147.1 2-hydroxyacid dehydrogenase [Serratia sp. Ag1]